MQQRSRVEHDCYHFCGKICVAGLSWPVTTSAVGVAALPVLSVVMLIYDDGDALYKLNSQSISLILWFTCIPVSTYLGSWQLLFGFWNATNTRGSSNHSRVGSPRSGTLDRSVAGISCPPLCPATGQINMYVSCVMSVYLICM